MPLRRTPREDQIAKEQHDRKNQAPKPRHDSYNYIHSSIKLSDDKKEIVAVVVMRVTDETPIYIEYSEAQLENLIASFKLTLADVKHINAKLKG